MLRLRHRAKPYAQLGTGAYNLVTRAACPLESRGQVRMCREGVDVVTGTPARIIDFVQSGKLDLSAVRFFVLDEADRLLDTGSADTIMKLWRLFPKQRVGVHRMQVRPAIVGLEWQISMARF